jgi:Na+-transporting methylmalonyl-CoA/oxaloacetate decarboxylase gamma subunit
MSVWDKYKLNDLPEEARAEVIKAAVHELEETERARVNNSNYHTVRGMAVVFLFLATVPAAVVGYYWQESWKEVKIKSMTPMVCPAPPPCPAAPIPSFDIKVVPSAPAK